MKVFKNSVKWFDLKVFLNFAGGNIIFQIVFIICDIYLLKLISVEFIGFWQYGMLIQGYVVVSRLGIINAFNRDYPYFEGQGNTLQVSAILKTTSFHTLMSSIFQSVVFLIITIYFYYSQKPQMFTLTMFVMCIYTLTDSYSNFLEAKFRGSLNFNKISLIKIILAITCGATLIFPYYLYYNGLLIRLIIIQLIQLLLFSYFDNSKVIPEFSKLHWIELFKDGWKFWLWSYLKSFNKSIPRLFIISFSTLLVLGYFTPINWFLGASVLITGSLSSYLYPILSRKISKGNISMGVETLKINFIVFLIGIPFVVVGIFLLPYFVNWIIPQYIDVIFPMRLTLVASLFEIIALSSVVWASQKEWGKMFFITILSILLNILTFIWVYFNQENLLVKIGYCILINSVVIALIINLIIIFEHYHNEKKTSVLYL